MTVSTRGAIRALGSQNLDHQILIKLSPKQQPQQQQQAAATGRSKPKAVAAQLEVTRLSSAWSGHPGKCSSSAAAYAMCLCLYIALLT
eukprot:1150171-Pelagomonas_calceolata.AAC.6